MKNISLLAVALLVFGFSYGQLKTDTTYTYEWDQKSKTWEENERTIITSNGNTSSELVQVLEFGKWNNYSFSLFYYNDDNQMERIVEQYWNDLKNKWQDDGKVLYSYNPDGTINEILYQNKFHGEFLDHRKEIHIYNEEGVLIEKIIKKNNGDWANLRQYNYQYEHNFLKEEKLTIWENDSWKEMMLTEFTYNPWGKTSLKTRSLVSDDIVIPFTKESYVYDNSQNLESVLHEKYNNRNEDWEAVSEHSIRLNDQGQTNFICKYRNNNKWVNYCKVERQDCESIDTFDGVLSDFYLSVSTDKLASKAFINFDNPFNEIFHVAVYDSSGNKLTSSMLSEGEISFDLSENNIDQDFYIEFQGSELYSGKFSIN